MKQASHRTNESDSDAFSLPFQQPKLDLKGKPPVTALAPMQDVTNLPFMRVIDHYGSPDFYFTEYFRVYENSQLDAGILSSITENPSDKPVFAQLIGEDIFQIERTIEELQKYPIAGVDLNMGCPAPKVYRKKVGGGLLRDMEKVDALLGAMRAACPGNFTVKMRIGFEDARNFETLLSLINKHQVNLLSLHARTVKEMYRSDVHYEFIKQAVETIQCPVFANGNITSAEKSAWAIQETGAAGVMIGRSAIRNPWIFQQTRQKFADEPIFHPCLSDVRDYIERLYEATGYPGMEEIRHVARIKKFLNFIGQGVDPEGAFLHKMRRTRSAADLFGVCDTFLSGAKADLPFAPEPYSGVIARPNHEANVGCGLPDSK